MKLWLLPLLAYCKFISSSVTLSETDPWRYLTKFAADIGSGSYSLRARFLKPQDSTDSLALSAAVYLDSTWEDAMSQTTCGSKVRHSKVEKTLNLPSSGEWSNEVSGTLTQRVRPYFWYFALAECNGKIHESVRIKFEITLINSDGSHFSLEDKGLEYAYLLAFLIFLITLSSNVVRLVRRYQKSDSLEGPLLMVNWAVLSQLASILFELCHLWAYSYDGKGIVALDFLSQAADLICQLTISVMFILISMGWTIRYKEFPDVEIYIPVAFLIVVMHVLTAGLGRISDDSYNKFTDYEGVAGILLILLRLCLFGWFGFSAKQLYEESQGAVAASLWSLSLVASGYFLALPGLALTSRLIAPYLRNRFLVLGNLGGQIVAFVVLTRLLDARSSYYQVSTLSDSVLPGNKLR